MTIDPPTRVRVGPHPYKLRYSEDVDHVVHGHSKGTEEAEGLYGHANHRSGILDIGTDMTLSQMQDTVLHETLHAVLLYLAKDDEQLVWVLAPALLDLMQRNPKLVEFLMQKRVVSW